MKCQREFGGFHRGGIEDYGFLGRDMVLQCFQGACCDHSQKFKVRWSWTLGLWQWRWHNPFRREVLTKRYSITSQETGMLLYANVIALDLVCGTALIYRIHCFKTGLFRHVWEEITGFCLRWSEIYAQRLWFSFASAAVQRHSYSLPYLSCVFQITLDIGVV
jgi:hypothetical protein